MSRRVIGIWNSSTTSKTKSSSTILHLLVEIVSNHPSIHQINPVIVLQIKVFYPLRRLPIILYFVEPCDIYQDL